MATIYFGDRTIGSQFPTEDMKLSPLNAHFAKQGEQFSQDGLTFRFSEEAYNNGWWATKDFQDGVCQVYINFKDCK